MQNVIDPTARIPLYLEPGGWVMSPWFDFDEERGLIYIFQYADYAGFWGRLWWHAPTIAAAVALFMLLFLSWRSMRVLRTRRQVGHRYCRGCNYEVTGRAGSGPVLQCPECGRDLQRRRGSVPGRTRLYRLAPAAIAAAVVWPVCAVTVFVTTTAAPGGRFAGGVTGQEWRLPILSSTTILGLGHEDSPYSMQTIVAAHRLKDGRRHELPVRFLGSGWGAARLTPDGRQLLAMSWEDDGTSNVRLINLADGHERRVRLSPVYKYPSLIAFSEDGQRAFVRTLTPHPGQGESTMALHELHLGGAWMQLVTEMRTEGQREQHFAAVDRESGEIAWVLVSAEPITAGGLRIQVTTPSGEESKEFSFEVAGTGIFPPRLMEHGKVLQITRSGGATSLVNLETQVVEDGPPRITPFYSNSGPVRDGPLAAREDPAGPGRFELLRDDRVIATLAGVPGQRSFPIISPSGRWAAAIYFWTEPTALSKSDLALPKPRHEMLVWDLHALERE